MSDTHEKELHNFCRVCGRKLNKGYKHKCSNSATLLQSLGVDISGDKSAVHPPFYCHNCHTTAKRLEKIRGGESSLKVHLWSAHGDGCEVCTMSSALHLGGRKMMEPVKRGRPGKSSKKGIANAIQRDAPGTWKMTAPLSLSRFLPPSTNLNLSDFQCAICNNIVDRPVTTPCRKLVCAECVCDRVRTSAEDEDMQCQARSVFINPRRACARVTVVVSVCLSVCLSVCVSVTALAAPASVYIRKQRYSRVSLRLYLDFDSWIFEKTFRSRVMA